MFQFLHLHVQLSWLFLLLSPFNVGRNGANTKGYFLWGFLDGFELLGGYKTGYGLYYVDLDDKQLRRYPKYSAHWYSNFLKGRNISLPSEATETESENFVSPLSKASQ